MSCQKFLRRIERVWHKRADRLCDKASRNWRAIVMEHRNKLLWVDCVLGDQQRAQLRVAVLLDDKNTIMCGNKIDDALAEWEGADAQSIYIDAAVAQKNERLVHRGGRGAVMDYTRARRSRRPLHDWSGHVALSRFKLAKQTLHVFDVRPTLFRVTGIGITRGAAREIGAAGRVRSGVGAIRNSVSVNVVIPAEITTCRKIIMRHHFAAIELARVVPRERRDQAVVHPDIEIEHDEDGRLQPVG